MRTDDLAGRVAALPPITAANTILRTVYKPPRFLVPGIVPDSGIIVMAASKAAGKTWVLLQIGAAVATGGLAFGRLQCEQARVLFLELELSERRLCERFGKMRLDDLPSFDVATAWRSGPEGLADMEAAVKEHGYGLIVVDVLARLWPRGSDMNDYGTVYNLLGPVRDMTNRLGVAIVLVTHTRKSEAEDAIDQVMGSVAVVGTADVVLALKRARGSDDAVLRADGNDIESQEIVLRFKLDPMGFEIVDVDPREAGQTAERRQILDILRGAAAPMRTSEIAVAMNKKDDTVSKLLARLKKEGLVCSPGYGSWQCQSVQSGKVEGAHDEQLSIKKKYSSQCVQFDTLNTLPPSGLCKEDDRELDIF
jgi:RecA-family ATPase